MIDLDRFKQVNDSVGMAVGDSILLTIARRLSRLLKPQDTLARLSGDQFAMILLSEREPARIVGFAETIRRALRAPIAFNDREIFLTASIGMALAENETQHTDEVLKDAELAMYYAKRIGGDRIEIFSRPCGRARPIVWLWNRNCAAPSSARKSRCCTSQSSGWKIARLPDLRRLPAGIIQNWAACRLRNSSTSPRRSA